MKKAIIGSGLFVSGVINLSTQRLVDTLLMTNDWHIAHSGTNLLVAIGILSIVAGIILCVSAFWEKDR